MADTPPEETGKNPKKRSRMPLILGLVLALIGGGAGFFATFSGLLPAPSDEAAKPVPEVVVEALPDIAFVPLEPIIVAIPASAGGGHLRFRAELEVPMAHKSDVEHLTPRVMDVLNTYLRALEPADLNQTAALVALRAQMLRRVQVVAGEGRVRDLLIMEFVLS